MNFQFNDLIIKFSNSSFYYNENRPITSVVKHIAMDAEGLGCDSLSSQIGHSVANNSPLLRSFFVVCCPGAKPQK